MPAIFNSRVSSAASYSAYVRRLLQAPDSRKRCRQVSQHASALVGAAVRRAPPGAARAAMVQDELLQLRVRAAGNGLAHCMGQCRLRTCHFKWAGAS